MCPSQAAFNVNVFHADRIDRVDDFALLYGGDSPRDVGRTVLNDQDPRGCDNVLLRCAQLAAQPVSVWLFSSVAGCESVSVVSPTFLPCRTGLALVNFQRAVSAAARHTMTGSAAVRFRHTTFSIDILRWWTPQSMSGSDENVLCHMTVCGLADHFRAQCSSLL